MAPVKCYYHNCINTSLTKSIFRFPVHDEVCLKLWIQHSGNANLNSLTLQELKHRQICEDHFKPEDVLKHSSRARLAYRAVPLMWKPATPQSPEENLTVVQNIVNKCSECSRVITGYHWWCLQCPGGRCHICAWRMRHRLHFLLRAPSHATFEQTEEVVEAIKKQLPDGFFRLPDSIRHVDENGVDLKATEEPEVKAEPPEEEDDPLAGCNPIPNNPKEPPSIDYTPIPNIPPKPPSINHKSAPKNPEEPPSIDYSPPNNLKKLTSIDYNFPYNPKESSSVDFNPLNIPEESLSIIDSNLHNPAPNNSKKPPSIAYNPLNNSKKPPSIAYNPPNNSKKPPSTAYNPNDPKKPPSIDYNPPNDPKKSPSIAYNPLNNSKEPPSIAYKPPNNPIKPPSIDYQLGPDWFRSDLQNRPVYQPEYIEQFYESQRPSIEIFSPVHPGLDDYEFSLAECSGIDDFRVTDPAHFKKIEDSHLSDEDHRPPSIKQSPTHTYTYSHNDNSSDSEIEASDYSTLELHADIDKDPLELDTTEQENDNQLKRPWVQVLSAETEPSTSTEPKNHKIQPRTFANKKQSKIPTQKNDTDKERAKLYSTRAEEKTNTEFDNRPEQLESPGQSLDKTEQQNNDSKRKRVQYATHIQRDIIVPPSDHEIDIDIDRVREMDTRDIDLRSEATTTLLNFEDIIRRRVFEYPMDIEELT